VLRRRLIATLSLCGLLLAGCGDAKPSAKATKPRPASGSAAPAAAQRIAGAGYEVAVAEGWYDIKKDFAGSEDSDLLLGTTRGSIMTTVVTGVPHAPGPRDDRERKLKYFTSVLLGDGERLSASQPIDIDGSRGLITNVRLKTDQGQALGRVVVVIHDDAIYGVAASSSPKERTSVLGDVAAMLRSWRWT
jgi:hypothetical protein